VDSFFAPEVDFSTRGPSGLVGDRGVAVSPENEARCLGPAVGPFEIGSLSGRLRGLPDPLALVGRVPGRSVSGAGLVLILNMGGRGNFNSLN
jgi:hypothetical protein